MPRHVAAAYAAVSTAIAVGVIVAAGAVFGFFGGDEQPSEASAEVVATVAGAAPAHQSALGDLDAMRAAALNQAAAQVAAQRAALQEQALREVDAQRRAAMQALVDELDRTRSSAPIAQTPAPAATPAPSAPPGSTATTASSTTTNTLSDAKRRELLAEIAKKTAECERKSGEDRQECLAEVARLQRRLAA